MPSDQPASSGTSTEIHSKDQPATTRQSNAKKRTAPDEGSSSQTREIKKLKTESSRRSDKKKRTVKKKRSQPITARVLPTNGLPPHHSGKHAQRGSMAIKQLRSEVKDKAKSPALGAENGDEGAAQDGFPSAKQLSAPSSSKGKSRDTTPASAKSNEEVLRLRKEVEQLTSLLQMHQKTLTQVHQNATCQICIDTMHKPYTLAPCGHLACYDCLVSWFKAPAPSGGDQPPPLARRKTCPHCRAVVRERPIEAWGVKSIVHNLVESGLLKGVSAPTATPEENAPKDLWEGIFRPLSKNPDTDPYGLFEGRIDRLGGEMSGPQIGMYDAEDGVHRCIDCMHELFGGVCSSCAREYPENPEFGMDDEDSDTDLDFGGHGHRRFGFLGQLFANEPEFDDEEDLDEDEDYPIVHHPWPPQHHHHRHHHHPHPDDEEGSDYEGSFIDDGPAPVRNEVIEIDGDSESGEEDGTPAHHLGNGTIELDDDDDDDISVDDSAPVRRVPARRLIYNVDSDEEQEMDSDVDVQVHHRHQGPR
ncbi:hypothetical protein BDV98DRAFT_360989 [Pterulicium gracile]|uniref:RING-type domain-containing protein n=1 Tax=Pterulicium gracile TaxID=1884261 RepID=A0A5C3R0B3_9AGAR|nr:hypothetical protein BDV98DRAFT_360989 [Pterula gracilis]